MAAVRYVVTDVNRSISFYTGHLGFKLDHNAAPTKISNEREEWVMRHAVVRSDADEKRALRCQHKVRRQHREIDIQNLIGR